MILFPYVLLLIIPIILKRIRIIESRINVYARRKNYSMMAFWILLFLMLALRHKTVGRDLATYEYIFVNIARSSWMRGLSRSPEIAWSFTNKLVAVLGGDFQWVIVIAALMGTYSIAKAYVKYADDTALTIVLFINMPCFILLFSGIRQSIAISFGFWAFEYVKEKKLVPFLCVALFAILFHTSAFMILFMYPLYHVRLKKAWAGFAVPLLIVIFAYKRQIFMFLGYILSTFTDYDTTIQMTGAYTMLVLFAILAFFAFVIPNENKIDDVTRGMRNYLLMAVVLQMFSPLHHIAMRMNYYFIAFIPLVIPRIIRYRSVRWTQVAIVARYVMLFFFFAYFVIVAPKDNLLDTFPYRFIWE